MPGLKKQVHFSPTDQVHILPPIESSSVLNPALAFSMTPVLYNNVAVVPTHITQNNIPLPASLLADTAVYPPVASLSIISREVPWRLEISASAAPYITVADVLSGVHAQLRLNASGAEYSALPASSQKLVTKAYMDRCNAVGKSPKQVEQEKLKGLKRVDFLASRTQWLGLVETADSPHVWEVRFI